MAQLGQATCSYGVQDADPAGGVVGDRRAHLPAPVGPGVEEAGLAEYGEVS
ncbi:hypothetical protein [Salinispora pacifica]|uniref:hypothetical protein n=1 Tax=Salinispora pacifica TaxID=351187 RepID=UPI000370CF1B|nr:hypothetical protein [Salinispora pacifica]